MFLPLTFPVTWDITYTPTCSQHHTASRVATVLLYHILWVLPSLHWTAFVHTLDGR